MLIGSQRRGFRVSTCLGSPSGLGAGEVCNATPRNLRAFGMVRRRDHRIMDYIKLVATCLVVLAVIGAAWLQFGG